MDDPGGSDGGANQIIAVEPGSARRRLAGGLGATDLVDPAETDAAEQVRAPTSGRGADYALEAAGSTTAMEQGFQVIRPAGTLVITGLDKANSTVTLPALDFIPPEKVLGSQGGGSHLRRDVARYVEMMDNGLIDRTRC